MRTYRSYLKLRRKGFTLAECIIAMVVLGIILTAAAGLAFAMNSAERVTDDMGESQAHVRYATVRISEMIRNSNMVFATSYLRNGIAIWTDDNKNGFINGNEIVYIEHDSANSKLEIVEYPNIAAWVTVDEVETGWARGALEGIEMGRHMEIVFNCNMASFPATNPVDDLVTMKFRVEENGQNKLYQITARKMVSMDYLLDENGELKSGDDDL